MGVLNLSWADLEKLKKFIDFVLENPKVLNMPQLQFLRDLIEKFGGKVPAGEYMMPTGAAGGECPFSGGASTGITFGMKMDESKLETESENASDMDAQSQHDQQEGLPETPPAAAVDSASAVYLEDTKSYRRSRKKPKRKADKHSYASNTKKERDDEHSDEHLECHVECIIEHNETNDSQQEDPINILSMHIPTIKTEPNATNNDEEAQDEADIAENGSDRTYKENSVDSDDDEPIIKRRTRRRITRQAAKRGWKKLKAASSLCESKKVKKPRPIGCGLNCKYSCTKKIDATQRNELCKKFWALTLVERKEFLMTCFERKPLGPMRLVRAVLRRNFTKDYFLCAADGERVRVCMSFFLSTLNISNYLVNEAIMHSKGEGKLLGEDMRGGGGAEHQAKLEVSKESETTAETSKRAEAEDNVKNSNETAPLIEVGNKTDTLTGAKEDVASKQLQLPAVVGTTATLSTSTASKAAEPKPKTPKLHNPSKTRVTKRDRAPQPVNCAEICKWKCHTSFSEEQRKQICAAFWDMSFKRRKDFVLSRIETRDISRMTAEEYRKSNRAQRAHTNRYFFRDSRGNIRVCAHFFMATLCITRHYIQNAQRNIDKRTGTYAGEDKRGRVPRPNKIDEETQNMIRRHIESYPTWMPHKNYKRRFLHSSLTKSKIYAEYKQQCEKEQRKSVCFNFFMKIFDRDFQLSFLKPTSKHAHKVSPQKKTLTTSVVSTTQPDEPAQKETPNISEFTGEEGGFWVNPDRMRSSNIVQSQFPQQGQTVSTSTIQYAQPAAVATYAMQYGFEHNPVFQAPSYGEQTPNLQLL